MKKYISSVLVGAALIVLSASCSKDTEGMTGITYYPVLELKGNPTEIITSGHSYADPGATATLNGEDVTDQIKVTTSLDFNDPKPGYYTIGYSVVNTDGFASSATRYVLVTDPNEPATGFYTVNSDSYRDYKGTVYFGGYEILIYGDGHGNYSVSDLLGGWYEFRAGYGSSYALTGDVTITADGTVSLVSSFLEGWGDGADEMTEGKFDAATKTIQWDVVYAGMPFHISATQN